MFQLSCDCAGGVSELLENRDEAETRAVELSSIYQCPCHITQGVDHIATVRPANGSAGSTISNGGALEPPSTYAIFAALDGEPEAWNRVAILTAIRSAMILPGLWLVGIRGWRLFAGSALASASITGILLGYYKVTRR